MDGGAVMQPVCDISHCDNPAAWVNVGDHSDLYLCAEHFYADHIEGWLPWEPPPAGWEL